MQTLYQALLLKKLYLLRDCGFSYCEPQLEAPMQRGFISKTPQDLKKIVQSCQLCAQRNLEVGAHFGLCNPNSKLTFVTFEPLLDAQMRFSSHTAIMLKNVIVKVFFLTLKEVSILSLLKCEIPPKFQEKSAELCLEYFLKQLEFSRAHFIVALGEKAYFHLTKDKNCEDRGYYDKIRGKLIDFGCWRVFPTDSLHSLVQQKERKARAHKEFLYLKTFL